jgi:hypothetical protein
LTAALFSVFWSGAVMAQATQTAPQPAPPPPAATPAPAVGAQGTTAVTVAPAPAQTTVVVAPGPEADDDDKPKGPTDHEQVVGGWGVGLLSSVELRPLSPGPAYPEQSLVLAIIGARTWFSEAFGFEIGLGFNTANGTRADDVQNREDVPEPTIWGLGLHLGLPLSFYDDAHYQFLLLPELNFGMAIGRTEDDPNTEGDQAIRRRAQLVGGGLRAGAEVQFGMIGLPMLALQGTVGVRLNYHQSSVEAWEGGGVITRVRRGFSASTSSFNDPWDLFVSSIAALYYFK